MFELWEIENWNDRVGLIGPTEFAKRRNVISLEMNKPEKPVEGYVHFTCRIKKIDKRFERFQYLQVNIKFMQPENSTPEISDECITVEVKNHDFSLPIEVQLVSLRWDTEIDVNRLNMQFTIWPTTEINKKIKRPPLPGLQRSSNTCYMNVIIQALYHIPAFRRLVYDISTKDMVRDERKLAVALQLLFNKMFTTKDEYISIDGLLTAFNMDRTNDIEQDDTHQFLISIFNELGQISGVKEKILDIFGFKHLSGKSKNVEDDIFWSLNLVQGKTFIENIELDRAPYTLENGETAQDIFMTLPKMLIIHLSISEKEKGKKTTPYINFPEKLDLSKYVQNDEYKKKGEYSLYCVIMHNGFMASGHFYACLRPSFASKFVTFNDKIVSYEKNILMLLKQNEKNKSKKPDAYPYLFIYFRNDCKEELGPKQGYKMPSYINDGTLIEERKLTFLVRTKLCLAHNINNGIIGFSQSNATHTYRVEANSKDSYNKLYQIVKEETKTKNDFRLWIRNKESLIGSQIPKTDDNKLVELNDNILFMDELDFTEQFKLPFNQIRLFLVYFDPRETKFEFIAARTVTVNDKIRSIVPSTIKLLNHNGHKEFGPNTKFDIYNDDLTRRPVNKAMDTVFVTKSFKQGSILIFVPSEVPPKVEKQPALSSQPFTLKHFYEKERVITIENYYEHKFCSWDFRVLFFGDKKDIVINIPCTKKLSTLVDLLVECTNEKYDRGKDEFLIFPVEYENYPDVRPLIDPSPESSIEKAIPTRTAFYFYIAYGHKGEIFIDQTKNSPKYALVRVSLSKDGVNRSAMYETVVKIPFTPKDVAESLKLTLPETTRIRNIVSSAKWAPLTWDTKIDERFYHIRFEEWNKCENEITVLTGDTTKNNNLYFYGEPFLLPVNENETFNALEGKFMSAFVDNHQAVPTDFIIINQDAAIVDEYFNDSMVPIIEAAKKGFRFVATKCPSKYKERKKDIASRC